MLTSLSFIFLVGLALGAVCRRLKLPGIIGMLATGMLLGPYVWNVLDSSILSVSADLRKMALIIILLKAGLSLNLSDLKKVGRPAVLLSFLPATFEIGGHCHGRCHGSGFPGGGRAADGTVYGRGLWDGKGHSPDDHGGSFL